MNTSLLPILILLLTSCISAKGTMTDGRGYIEAKVSIPIEREQTTVQPEVKEKISFQIKQGMSKLEVIDIAGRPHHVIGQKDFAYEERQRAKYGFVVEIWHYVYPEKFVVSFKDDEVYDVKYMGETELLDIKEGIETEI